MSSEIVSGLLGLLMVSTAGLIRGFSGFGFSIAAGMVGWISLAAAAIGLPAVWLSSRAGNRLFLRSADGHYRRVALAILTVTVILAVARVLLSRFT